MPDIKNLSSVGFEDYVKIKRTVKHDGKLPTEVIAQHDKDKVTFKEAYNVIEDTIKEFQNYSIRLNDYNTDLVSALCSRLYELKVLTEKDVQLIVNIASKNWEEKQHGKA